jgi:hypothetical protein
MHPTNQTPYLEHSTVASLRRNALAFPLLAIAIASCKAPSTAGQGSTSTQTGSTKEATKPAATSAPVSAESSKAPSAAELAFRDAVLDAPPNWKGPRFQLSHNYPSSPPTCASPWLQRKVKFGPGGTWKEWEPYIQDIVNYVRDGQDENLSNEIGWRATIHAGAKNEETRWFHVPWMAYDGERGREFVHGLTNELSTAQSSFTGRGGGQHKLPGASSDALFETWSVGFYNPCGAYSIGQQWPSSGEPATYRDNDRLFARGMPFPDGTVVVKVLNTTASATDVPYLKNSTTWQAHAHRQESPTKYSTCEREIRDVHLVQMDLAVVDSRSPTRWVYSTLVYDGELPGATVWDRLRPLGVQWGNDPGAFPAVENPKQTKLVESIRAPVKTYEHYGCGKRLAGNVDQANSSCTSCHLGAYAAKPGDVIAQGENVPAIFSFDGICTTYNTANKDYFSNYAYPAAYPGSTGDIAAAIPLDTSLQLQVAFAQYAYFRHPEIKSTCPPAH